MARQLRYTNRALSDLDAIQRWQTQPGSGIASRQRLRAMRTAISRLVEVPCLHAPGEQPDTREFSSEGHRVVYQVIPDTGRDATAGDVMVLRVFGPGQSRGSGA